MYSKSPFSIKFKKTIENFKKLYYYNRSTNQKKSKKEAQNMKKAKTFTRVERVTTLINNQAKKLALLIIFKTGTKHRDV